ncbi:MAG: DUF3823 domain-containing protein [Bacteroides sp.]|nr:DUF3823 domain-containing protein [Bacteroides sp.]
MKTLRYITVCLCLILGMSVCELDNFDGPNAQVYGALIDEVTGEPIQQEIGTSGEATSIQVIELGFSVREVQRWKIMPNGEYRNNLVFAADYDIIMNNGNFVKLDTIRAYRIRKGENKLDFHLTPNIRIRNPKVEKQANAIVASFQLEYGHDTGKVREIALFGQSDQNPSSSFYLCAVSSDVADQELNYANNDAYKDRVFTLTLDLDSDEGRKLQSGKTYFFRIGAVPTDLGEGIQEKYNYAPAVSIRM